MEPGQCGFSEQYGGLRFALLGNFVSGGLWQWNGTTWSQVNAVSPNNMVASSSILYGTSVQTGSGNGTVAHGLRPMQLFQQVWWRQFILYGDFGSGGLWQWDGTTWSQVNAVSPTSMVVSGSLLYGNFRAGGLWQWNGTTWSQVNAVAPTIWWFRVRYCMELWRGGLWQWDGTTWSQVNAVAPTAMVAGP